MSLIPADRVGLSQAADADCVAPAFPLLAKGGQRHGFSLVEALLTIAVLAVIGVGGVAYYRNYAKTSELEEARKSIIFDLRQAQAKAIASEDASHWGIRFVNAAGSDYYENFSTTDYIGRTVKETIYLPGSMTFAAPTMDVIFDRLHGTTNPNRLITIQSEGRAQDITVTTNGNIY
ncbi:MAG: prepilin-type N-terminal cleavage/methylation domain-containing protein [Candidatus Kerfeldbacteria bacterium]|nr:prepilin-type N-terminal cleavage/methylation domain-containing protein [Candidatus Kerfeldbacteria bacterium]